MGTASGTVLWTVLTDTDETLSLFQRAAAEAGFQTECPDAAELCVDVPRSLLRRRRATRLKGSVATAGQRTEVVWTSADPESGLYEHLLSIEENLPEGVIYYHGLTNAAARAGLTFDGRKVLRDIVCLLERDEVVRAVGKGQLTDVAGFVVLTARRLAFVPEGAATSVPVMDVPIESIEAISLGKRISGETLRVALPGTVTEIAHLGHGEGHGIATSLRQALNEQARATPISPRDSSREG